jgi:hypothetical protein
MHRSDSNRSSSLTAEQHTPTQKRDGVQQQDQICPDNGTRLAQEQNNSSLSLQTQISSSLFFRCQKPVEEMNLEPKATTCKLTI